jgi:hypothetical protein
MAPAAMMAMAPAHFFRLEMIDLFTRGDRRMSIRIARGHTAFGQRLRHQGRCLRTRSERHAACRKSKRESQKVPAFHHISSSALGSSEANNLQQSWRFDREPPKAVLRDVWTIDWILGG